MNNSIHIWLSVSLFLYLISLILITLKKERLSVTFLITGIVFYTLYLILRVYICGFLCLQGAFDSVFLTPWTIAISLILLYFRYHKNVILYAIIVLIISTVLPLCYPKGIIPPSPNKSIFLAYIFFMAESFSIGLFYISGCYSLLYLLITKNDFFNYSYQCIIYGFILFSIAQFIGALWCYAGWAVYFKWSPRHLQSALIWVLYINFIHLKYLPFFNSKTKSLYALISSLLTFFFYISSYLHEYSIPRIGN